MGETSSLPRRLEQRLKALRQVLDVKRQQVLISELTARISACEAR